MNETKGIREFFRVREICEMTGMSKAKVFQALREGKLDGRILDGVLLITAASLEQYLASAEPWEERHHVG